MKKEFKNFEEFYPYYIDEHKNKYNKLLHFIGTSIFFIFMIIFISSLDPKYIFYAFLRKKDRKLEDKYFHATKAYLEFYEKLLGPYPYKKFALIENNFAIILLSL